MELKVLLPLVLQFSLMLIVASVGLRSRPRDLDYALRRPAMLFRGLVAVNLVVPATAVALALLLPIEPAVKGGIVLMAVSPLAPLVLGTMLKSGAEASFAVGLYFALILLAVPIVPATLVLLSAIFPADARLPLGEIAGFLLYSVLAPLVGGLVLARLLPRQAAMLARLAAAIGNLLLLPLILLILYVAGGAMLGLLGDGTLLAIVATVAAGLAAGHLFGGPSAANRMALAAAAATRHPGIAALIAQHNFDDRRVMLAIMLFLLVGILVSALYRVWAKRRLDEEDLILNNNRHVATG